MSTGAAHSILVDEMEASKIGSRWIPHALTEAEKDNRCKVLNSNLLVLYDPADSSEIM